jgi:uncharacterized membrane protein
MLHNSPINDAAIEPFVADRSKTGVGTMFHNIIASSAGGDLILQWIEVAALAIEVLAVVIIVVAILYSMARYSIQAVFHPERKVGDRYGQLKASLGRSLLLGLEILVAADIVRTVALEATLQSVLVLGLLVLIRTFLSWALVVEIEGRWPWQPPREG